MKVDTYVTPPNPMEVKKLMENRVFRGLSRGKIPSKYSAKNLTRNENEKTSVLPKSTIRISVGYQEPMFFTDAAFSQ